MGVLFIKDNTIFNSNFHKIRNAFAENVFSKSAADKYALENKVEWTPL